MTLFKPTLRLARLMVTRKGKSVYDERFHPGVNIIRGMNSSGKSTIINFTNFVLGGEPGKFTEEAATCDFVYGEVKINGENVSLRREIDNSPQRPLSIYWGPLEKAIEVGDRAWELYPYAVRGSKESFSQVLFRALEIPEVRSEQMSARVTMHQLLRLIYSDQMTSPERIFRAETFDYADVKDAVGRLLCGVYDDEIYDLKIRVKDLEDEKSVITQQLKTVLGILSDAEQIPNAMELEGALRTRKERRKEVYANLMDLRSRKQLAEGTEGEKSKRVMELVQELQEVNLRLGELEKNRHELIFEFEDTKLFIGSLEEKLRCIEEAIETRKTLGTVDFDICPAC
jgi:energy-coupling factor transporter ATP-binding protein EcfA2